MPRRSAKGSTVRVPEKAKLLRGGPCAQRSLGRQDRDEGARLSEEPRNPFFCSCGQNGLRGLWRRGNRRTWFLQSRGGNLFLALLVALVRQGQSDASHKVGPDGRLTLEVPIGVAKFVELIAVMGQTFDRDPIT